MSAFKDKALPFARSYGLLIALGLAAIVALPTAFFFAQQMNASFTEDVQKQVTQDYGSVTASKNTYSLPGLGGDKVLEKAGDYNAELINWYKERWAETREKTGVVWDKGLAFNKSDHALLTQGLFPAPPDLEREVKIRELVGAVIAFHAKLLADAKAGAPPDAAAIAEQINDHRKGYIERIKAQGGTGELDTAEKDKLAKELIDVRVDRCRRRAAEINVYADPGVFEGIPTEVPTKAPTLAQAWDLEERSWIDADLIRAISAANQSTETGVPGAVVKRISRISVHAPAYDPANPAPQPFDAGEDKAAVDLARSLSGRISGPGTKNRWFDTRTAELDLVVSSRRLPQLIDALAAINFMTVLDVSLTGASPRDDLRQGFYYGDEHVVRAHLTVESVYLREWRKDWMPDDVKKALGMDQAVAAAPDASGAAPPRAGGGTPPGGGKSGGKRAN